MPTRVASNSVTFDNRTKRPTTRAVADIHHGWLDDDCAQTPANQLSAVISIVLIVGLAATRILGWWGLDSVAALALIPFIIKEARTAISGQPCSALATSDRR